MPYDVNRHGKRFGRSTTEEKEDGVSDAYPKSRGHFRGRRSSFSGLQFLKHNVFRPLVRGLQAAAILVTWDGLCTAVKFGTTAVILLVLLCEGGLSAMHGEGIARNSVEIEFPLQGLQTTASAEDFSAVRSSDVMTGKLSTRMASVDGIQLPAIGALLVDVIRTHHIKSMIDWPCREHREIVPPALYLGMNASTTKELDEASFRYFCMDTDSAELAESSFAVRDVVGRRRGLHYIRQRIPGSFRISKQNQTPARTQRVADIDLARSHNSPEQLSENDRQTRNVDDSRGPMESTDTLKEASLRRSSSASTSGAELIFSWGGRTGGLNSTTEVKELILSAAASGARFALIGAHAAYGTRWELPPATTGVVNDMTLGRFTGSKMPWFPFGNAIIFLSDEYSPANDGDAGDQRFLALYRLDALPEILVNKRRYELKGDGSATESTRSTKIGNRYSQ